MLMQNWCAIGAVTKKPKRELNTTNIMLTCGGVNVQKKLFVKSPVRIIWAINILPYNPCADNGISNRKHSPEEGMYMAWI